MMIRVLRKGITSILQHLNELASFLSIFVVMIDLMFYFDYPSRFTSNPYGIVLCNAIILTVFLVNRFWIKIIINRNEGSAVNPQQ